MVETVIAVLLTGLLVAVVVQVVRAVVVARRPVPVPAPAVRLRVVPSPAPASPRRVDGRGARPGAVLLGLGVAALALLVVARRRAG